jgi:chemotaxis protein methyltransferase CheR
MPYVKLQIVPENFHVHAATHIQQGEVSAGQEPQGTILKSCTCIGFYHPQSKVGAISHITGFSSEQGHSASGALQLLRKKMARLGVQLEECECFLVGGADLVRRVYDSATAALHEIGISYRELDVLGHYHRKLVFDPATGVVTLFKKHGNETLKEATKTFSSDLSYQCFHDQKRRLITGASLFFRNENLLGYITQTVAPVVTAKSSAFHIWCAGCSTGMETYSVGMVLLDWIEKNAKRLDLKILGTDISAEALTTASNGVYRISQRAFKEHNNLISRYTKELDANNSQIKPELRQIVTFKERDIREGSRHPLFDLVICDHVLQYFTVEIQLEFLKGLLSGVKPHGFLYVSSPSKEIETHMLESSEYEMLARHFYHRKV